MTTRSDAGGDFDHLTYLPYEADRHHSGSVSSIETQIEYQRLGAIAYANGRPRKDCKLPPSDEMQSHWLFGWDMASQGVLAIRTQAVEPN